MSTRTGAPGRAALAGRVPRTDKPAVRTVKFPAVDEPFPKWQLFGACNNEDPELFFPVGNSGPAVLQIEDAKAVCRSCAVASWCLKWAMDTEQNAGVWGGMAEEERRALKRRALRQAAKTNAAGVSS